MGVWTDHVFPRVVDRVLRTPEVNARRALVCGGLHGRVLEIGFGSGLNLRHYPAGVTEILIVEPSAVALRLAQPRLAVVDAPVTQVGVDGASLELPDESVDCVLSTYTLCTIPEVTAALEEMHRFSSPMASCTSSSTGARQVSPYADGNAGCIRCTAGSPAAATSSDRSTT